MKIIRKIVGQILLTLDFITRPRSVKRSEAGQRAVNEAAKRLQLYQFKACPFCIKVRRHARRLNVPLTIKDAKNDPEIKKELLEKGGSPKVPCLRIAHDEKVQWMYESKVIIQYLTNRFGSGLKKR